MAKTSLHPESVNSSASLASLGHASADLATPEVLCPASERPKLDTLEDAAADLDTSETFSRAANLFLNNVREYLKMMGTPLSGHLLGELNDLESMISEAQHKATAAKRTILAFHVSEFEAHRSGIG